MTDRHAYMIMAHTNYNQLAILIQTIDDIRNDIYLHIDKTNPLTEIEKNSLLSASKQSNLFFIKSRSVSWGADSLMNVEIALLDEAVKRPHKYYHLLSGMDLPIKTQSYIHDKLDCDSYDYISLERTHQHNISKDFLDRFRYYYPLQNSVGRSGKKKVENIQNRIISLQKRLKFDRTRNAAFEYIKGSQWFSITHKTAKYILDQYTYCNRSIITPLT